MMIRSKRWHIAGEASKRKKERKEEENDCIQKITIIQGSITTS